ncbi:FHA domain-containing protein [Pelobacter seleniigenes]|uniref:FHA domain-containing protein n=1 Tax=Pelobacter seleniigenes TaxID=407188 RepID=UPI00068CEDEE|nr:FHA domain-containing protein [Pelobacter seleniigenes]
MLKIELTYQGAVLETFTTDSGKIQVGRNQQNDIQIDSLAVSGRHALIRKVMNTYVIEDLGSTNGTFVNERKIDKYELLDGDEIIIGKHSLIFHYLGANTPKANNLDQTMILDTRRQKELLSKNRG